MHTHPTTTTTHRYRVLLCGGQNGSVIGAVSEWPTQGLAAGHADELNRGLTDRARRCGMAFRPVTGDAYALMRVADPVAFANDWSETYCIPAPEAETAPEPEPDPVPSVLAFEVTREDIDLLAADPGDLEEDMLIAKEQTAFRLLRMGEIDRLLRLPEPPGVATMAMLLHAIGRLSCLAFDDDPYPIGDPERFGLRSVDGFGYEDERLMATRVQVFGYPGPDGYDSTHMPSYVFGTVRHGTVHGKTITMTDGQESSMISLEQVYADVCRAYVWLFSQVNRDDELKRNVVDWLRKHPPMTMHLNRG